MRPLGGRKGIPAQPDLHLPLEALPGLRACGTGTTHHSSLTGTHTDKLTHTGAWCTLVACLVCGVKSIPSPEREVAKKCHNWPIPLSTSWLPSEEHIRGSAHQRVRVFYLHSCGSPKILLAGFMGRIPIHTSAGAASNYWFSFWIRIFLLLNTQWFPIFTSYLFWETYIWHCAVTANLINAFNLL